MTLDDPEQLVDRFHRVLVEEIRERRPECLSGPFTVAEIYQELIPYGSHRDRLGVSMNGDYEDVLLRLLAGQGDYLSIESRHARERLRDELESTNPDTGVFRGFAAVDVRLNPERLPDDVEVDAWEGSGDGASADAVEDGPDAGEAHADEEDDREAARKHTPKHAREGGGTGAGAVASDGDGDAGSDEGPDGPSGAGDDGSARVRSGSANAAVEPGGQDGPEASEEETATCRWCRETLPRREKLNYCPFCGTDVHVVPCPSCGEALEPRWRFCIACGAEVAPD